jgi:hypothetical protein
MTIRHGRFSYTAVLTSFLSFLQVSCKDGSTVSPVAAPALSVRGLERAGARFSADVEIITSGLVTGRWAGWPGAVSKISYHLDQFKTVTGWRTSYSAIRSTDPDWTVGGRPGRLPSLERVEVDEAGTVSMYNETGERLKPDHTSLASIRGRMATNAKMKAQTDAVRSRLATLGTPKATPGTRLSGLIVDRSAQRSIIGELASKGRLVAREGAKQRYQLALAKGGLEIAVDSVIGAIVEMTADADGSSTRATYEYGTTPAGHLVRTRLRTERRSSDTAPPFVSETRVSNITFDEGGGL